MSILNKLSTWKERFMKSNEPCCTSKIQEEISHHPEVEWLEPFCPGTCDEATCFDGLCPSCKMEYFEYEKSKEFA